MTLALYGKSRKRRGGLLLAALLAILVATLAGASLYKGDSAQAATPLPSNITLEQWQPVGGGSPAWITGALNPGKSDYAEGDVVPFRLTIPGSLAAGTYTFSVCRDYLSGGIYGYISLATYNTTKAADPGGTIVSTFGAFSGVGVTITGAVEVGTQGACVNSGGLETIVTITKPAIATDTYALWGGRISAPGDLGGVVTSSTSAHNYPGGSLHMSTIPSKDVGLQTNAISFVPTNPTVVKTVSTGPDATKAYWNIAINNTGANTVAATGILITDPGATLELPTSPSDANNGCVVTVAGTSFTCKVGANTTLNAQVSKPLTAATNSTNTCLPGTIDNSISSAVMGAAAPVTLTVTNPASTITVPGTAAASCVTIAKTGVVNGSANDYTITLTNTGPATSAIVKDAISGATLTGLVVITSSPSSPACTIADLTGAAGCTVNIAANGTSTLTVSSAAVTNNTCASINVINTATATWASSGTALLVTAGQSNTVSRSYPGITCAPGLTVSKSGPSSATQGGSLSYTVTVGNSALATANTSGTTTMTDTLPNGLTNVHASGSGWACGADIAGPTASSTISCTSTAVVVPGGSFPAITITATAPANVCAPISNVASASGGGNGSANSLAVITDVTGCAPVIVTPTPTAPTPTITEVTKGETTPGPATPTKEITLGEKTAGATPIAPSTGSGLNGGNGGSTNIVLALIGLIALSGSMATLAFSWRKSHA